VTEEIHDYLVVRMDLTISAVAYDQLMLQLLIQLPMMIDS
jgi:hypothetical protein